jgi:3-oxoacyl-[acyl-carrier protein] reductase
LELGIRDRQAVVFGATSGLGLATAHSLAAEGCELFLCARNQTKLEKTAEELRVTYRVQVTTHRIDVTDRDDVDRLATGLRARGLDILVLNTPRPPSPMREFLEESDDSRWRQAYTDQLESALYVLRSLAPIIQSSSTQGRIIGITSASVKQPLSRHAISTIFRAGVQAALKHLSLELAPDGITVNTIAPAGISTPTFAQFHDVQSRIAAIPLQRLGTLEEFGAAVAFLASRQSGFITGQCLQFDGGLTSTLT